MKQRIQQALSRQDKIGAFGRRGSYPNRLAQRASVALGGFTVIVGGIGGGVGISQGPAYVRDTLIPQISQELSHSLSRPVELGEVEHLSLTAIRLGPSEIPSTAADADTVAMDSVEVRFNLLAALNSRTVGLDVTLVNPRIYLDQNAAGDWIETDLQIQDEDLITIKHLRIKNGAIVLAPDPAGLNGEGVLHRKAVVDLPTSFEFNDIHAHASFGDGMEHVAFRAAGKSSLDGQFTLRGALTLETDALETDVISTTAAEREPTPTQPRLDLTVKTQNLSTLPLNLALPPAVRIIHGQMTSQIQIHLPPDADPAIDGVVDIQNLAAWVKGEPNPFTETEGRFRIQNQEIALANGFTRYGQIPFQVQGRIHLKEGLDLDAQVKSVSVPDFMNTFNLKLPFAAQGVMTTDNLRVTGPLEHAIFSGAVSNAAPVQMDRLTLDTVQTEFWFDTERDRLHLQDAVVIPRVGGTLRAQADVQLEPGDNDEATLTVRAEGLPGDEIARLYDLAAPTDTLGELQATAQVSITAQQPQVNLRWRSQGGRYPAEGSVVFQDDGVHMHSAVVQLAGHPVQVGGRVGPEQWSLAVDTTAMPLDAWKASLPSHLDSYLDSHLDGGYFDGQFNLAGSLDAFSLDDLTATGKAKIQLETGQLAVQTTMAQGRWQTQLRSTDLPIAPLMALGIDSDSEFAENVWGGALSGAVTLAGSSHNLDPAAITVAGDIQLNEYDLTTLPISLPQDVQLAGRASIQGSISGTPATPNLQGEIQLWDLAVNTFAFDPILTGTIQTAAHQGARLQLAGGQDAIALELDGDWGLTAFQAQLDRARVMGEVVAPNHWVATVQNLPLERLTSSGSPLALPNILSGQLSADVSVSLADAHAPEIAADFAIAQPRLASPNNADGSQADPLQHSRHQRDRLTGTLNYANGFLSLENSELWFGQSYAQLRGRTQLWAQVNPELQPTATAELVVRQGDLQDMATLIQSLDPHLSPTAPSEAPPAIESLAETVAPSVTLPRLSLDPATLSGAFSGSVKIQAFRDTPLAMQVDLQGQDWSMGLLGVQTVSVANARFHGRSLNLSELALDELNLSGLMYNSAAGERHVFDAQLQASRSDTGHWAGELRADNILLGQLSGALGMPLSMAGDVDAIAALSGNHNIPHVTGTVEIDDVCINTLTLDDIDLSVSHRNGTVKVGGWPIQLPETGRSVLDTDLGDLGLLSAVAALVEVERPFKADSVPIDPTRSNHAPGQLSQAEHIVITYGLLRRSFALTDLESFAETGIVPSSWEFYLNLTGLEPDGLHKGLTQKIQVDVTLVDRVLNSPLGKQLLDQIGQVLHTPSRQANSEALRAALVIAASNDNQISLLEFFQNYPVQELHIDGPQLLDLVQNIECDRINSEG